MAGRFLSLKEALARDYPFPVRKLPLDAGFTCPNRDGRRGRGGCAFCAGEAFSPARRRGPRPLALQLERGKAAARRRFGPACRFLAYFQPGSNTYAAPAEIERRLGPALRDPEVIGLNLGTRPDCLPADVLALLAGWAADGRRVELELGLQTAHDRTLARLNRGGQTRADFTAAAREAGRRGLLVTAHVILGLPGESAAMMLETARYLAGQPLAGLKLHHLYVAAGTPLAAEHAAGRLSLLTREEFVSLAARFLELVPATVAVHRLGGELFHPAVIAPRWGASRAELDRAVEEELAARDSRQGAGIIGSG